MVQRRQGRGGEVHTELQWPNKIPPGLVHGLFFFLYAGFNILVFSLNTYCMTSKILLLFSDDSSASTYRL